MQRLRTTCTIALAAGLAFAGLLAPAPAHAAGADSATPTGRAALWLIGQAPGGTLQDQVGAAPDYSLTSDAILGLHAAGASATQLAPFVDSVAAGLAAGRYGLLGSGASAYADGGALAKLLVVANTTGRNPRAFGGTDLVARVQAQVSGGRIGDTDPARPTPWSAGNTFAQSYAILGLGGAGQDTAALVQALLDQQCPGGDFRLTFGPADCTTGTASADRDVTAMAVTALRSLAAPSPAARSALDRAVAFLIADQGADGSWIASPMVQARNTNTTGLGIRALAGLRADRTSRALGFVAAQQLQAGPDAGAVAYSAAEKAAAGTGSIKSNVRHQWQRATAQALLGLAHFDVYRTPGTHLVNGRQWRTQCEPFSQTSRCLTEIWATRVIRSGNTYAQSNGWVFNNMTYLPDMTRSQWASNPLANAPSGTSRYWTSAGRNWRTECDTAITGWGGCRAYVEADVISLVGGRYRQERKYVFNNLVLFKQ